ncbi:MAG: hypothetical protein GX088_02825 [Clostridia bacterium]|nr:hypothetical protein [Clostridia bacterium]
MAAGIFRVIVVGYSFLTFDRMLVIVISGLVTVFMEGRLMARLGLYRESVWAKAIGWFLVAAGIGAWVLVNLWNRF